MYNITLPILGTRLKPVSYTHLDVYKRQYVNSGKQKVDNILNGIKWISKGGY